MQCFDMSKRLLAECSVPDVYQNKGRAALSLPPLVPSEMISLVQPYSFGISVLETFSWR